MPGVALAFDRPRGHKRTPSGNQRSYREASQKELVGSEKSFSPRAPLTTTESSSDKTASGKTASGKSTSSSSGKEEQAPGLAARLLKRLSSKAATPAGDAAPSADGASPCGGRHTYGERPSASPTTVPARHSPIGGSKRQAVQ